MSLNDKNYRNMPRRKLNRKTELIQILVSPEDKAAFDRWCAANSTTMSDVIRKEIAPYIDKGNRLPAEIAS